MVEAKCNSIACCEKWIYYVYIYTLGHFDSRPRRVMNTQLPATKKTFSATGGSFSYEKIPTLKMSVHPVRNTHHNHDL